MQLVTTQHMAQEWKSIRKITALSLLLLHKYIL